MEKRFHNYRIFLVRDIRCSLVLCCVRLQVDDRDPVAAKIVGDTDLVCLFNASVDYQGSNVLELGVPAAEFVVRKNEIGSGTHEEENN